MLDFRLASNFILSFSINIQNTTSSHIYTHTDLKNTAITLQIVAAYCKHGFSGPECQMMENNLSRNLQK